MKKENNQINGNKYFHICLNVQNQLNQPKHELKNMFVGSDGNDLTTDEAWIYLMNELAKGHKVIPFSQCNNFDYSGSGCQGHEEQQS